MTMTRIIGLSTLLLTCLVLTSYTPIQSSCSSENFRLRNKVYKRISSGYKLISYIRLDGRGGRRRTFRSTQTLGKTLTYQFYAMDFACDNNESTKSNVSISIYNKKEALLATSLQENGMAVDSLSFQPAKTEEYLIQFQFVDPLLTHWCGYGVSFFKER